MIKVPVPRQGVLIDPYDQAMLDAPSLRDTDPWRSILHKAARGKLGSWWDMCLWKFEHWRHKGAKKNQNSNSKLNFYRCLVSYCTLTTHTQAVTIHKH